MAGLLAAELPSALSETVDFETDLFEEFAIGSGISDLDMMEAEDSELRLFWLSSAAFGELGSVFIVI